MYAARISISVIVSWSCDQLLRHGKVHGKRLEFNDIQASYDSEIIGVIIIIMDRGVVLYCTYNTYVPYSLSPYRVLNSDTASALTLLSRHTVISPLSS